MKRPTLVLWEPDERLAPLLRPLASHRRWLFRQPRNDEELFGELLSAAPGVVVLRTDRHRESDLALLSRLSVTLPDVAVVVVTEGDDGLTGLAWDLGASEVLAAGRCRDELAPSVARFFQRQGEGDATDP